MTGETPVPQTKKVAQTDRWFFYQVQFSFSVFA